MAKLNAIDCYWNINLSATNVTKNAIEVLSENQNRFLTF